MENKVPWLFPQGAGFLTACYRRKGQADTDPLWGQWVLSTGPSTCVSGAPAIFYLQLCIIFLEGALEAVKAPRPTELGSAALGGKRYQYVLQRIVTCSFYVLVSRSRLSVQFSCSVVSDSLWPHGLQHARPLCPSPSPRARSNSHPFSQWCHPTFSLSVVPFSSCLQPLPASGSFPMSWIFSSGGQSICASASVLPMNTQGWFPLGLTGLIYRHK